MDPESEPARGGCNCALGAICWSHMSHGGVLSAGFYLYWVLYQVDTWRKVYKEGALSLLPFFLVLHLIVMHQCNFAMHPGYTYVHFSRAVPPTSQEKGQYVSDSLPQLYYYVYFTKYSWLSNYFKIHIPLIPVVVYCSIASAEHKCYCGRAECCMLCDFP